LAVKCDASFGNHPLDVPPRCHTRSGKQLRDPLRSLFARKVTLAWPRHWIAIRSFRVQSELVLFGGMMLFGKRKRVVKRILIVEDEPLTAFDNETMLTDLGYDVAATVDDFERAVALLDPESVDLVLSDLRLTGQRTGLDLARAARNKGIPVLLSTGYNIPEEARALVLGWLQKPYTERQLKNALEAVDRLLGGEKVKPGKGFELFATEQ